MRTNNFQCTCGALLGQYHKMSCYDPRRDTKGMFKPIKQPHQYSYWKTCGPDADACGADGYRPREDSGESVS